MLTTDEEAVVFVMNALDACGARWMLTGSLASNMFGVPRSTQDADFVIKVEPEGLRSFRASLDDRFQFDDQMRFETITMSTRHDLTLRDTGFRIELFFLAQDAFAQERFARRIVRDFCGRPAWVPTPEDVVIQKIRWSKGGRREKDILDVRAVIGVRHATLDWPYIERWCAEDGTLELLNKVRRESIID